MSNIVVIKAIKLNNVLSHEQTYIEFPLGLTALVGPNGAGKSSIIDAAIYALFINPQNIRGFRGSSKKSFLRIGSSSGYIEVELSIGGKKYVVYRGISLSKGDEAVLYEVTENEKKKVLAVGVQTVLDYVRKLLSIPSTESIRYTIISRQNEIARLIEEAPSTRKELVLKLLGLNELEKAKEVLKPYLESVKSDIKFYDSYKLELNEIREKVKALSRSIEADRVEFAKLENEQKILSEEIKRYEKLIELVKLYDKLSKAIGIVKELKEVESVLPLCREILSLDIENFISITNVLRDRKRDLDEALEKLKTIENEINIVLKNLELELEIQVPSSVDTKGVIEYLDELSKQIYLDKSVKQAEFNIAKNSVEIIGRSANCPLCGRELSDNLKERLLSEAKNRIDSILKELDELDKRYNKVKLYIDNVKKLEKGRLELQVRIENNRKIIEEYMNKYREIKNSIETVISKLKSNNFFTKCLDNSNIINVVRCIHRLAIETMKIYEEKKHMLRKLFEEEITIDEVLKKYTEVKNGIAELGFDINKININEIEARYKECLNRFNEVSMRIGQIKGRIESYLKMQEEFSKKEREIEEKLSQLKKSIEIYPVLDFMVNKLLGKDGLLAKMLTQESRRLIERYTNAILKELDMSFRIRIDEEFDISVHTPFGELDIRSLSGGEIVALAIALRIALAYTVFGRLPGFFILDEPTQFLDRDRRRSVFEIIKKLSERVPQVIVITHDVEVEELADKVVYVSKEGGRSIVREISEFEKITETV
ncbi:MAG: SMC family ATPase [Ignisphaera sp.]